MKTVKLIVYGTLLSGERNHHFCRNAVKITRCTVIGTLYDTGCGFPAFQVEGNTTIQAELIEIPIAGISGGYQTEKASLVSGT